MGSWVVLVVTWLERFVNCDGCVQVLVVLRRDGVASLFVGLGILLSVPPLPFPQVPPPPSTDTLAQYCNPLKRRAHLLLGLLVTGMDKHVC